MYKVNFNLNNIALSKRISSGLVFLIPCDDFTHPQKKPMEMYIEKIFLQSICILKIYGERKQFQIHQDYNQDM